MDNIDLGLSGYKTHSGPCMQKTRAEEIDNINLIHGVPVPLPMSFVQINCQLRYHQEELIRRALGLGGTRI